MPGSAPLLPPVHFSPSGQLLADSWGPRIFDMQDGSRVWSISQQHSSAAFQDAWVGNEDGQSVHGLALRMGIIRIGLVFLTKSGKHGFAVHTQMWS